MSDTMDIYVGIENLCGFIIIFIQGFIFVHHYICYRRSSNIDRSIEKWPFIFGFSCVICCGLSEMSMIPYVIKECHATFICNTNILEFLWTLFFIFGIVSMYGYLLHNLYYGFKNTPFSISLRMLVIFLSLVIIFGISFIAWNVIYHFCGTLNGVGTYLSILMFISGTSDFIVSSSLLILFIHKLSQIGNNISTTFNNDKPKINNLPNLIDLKQDFEDDIETLSHKATKRFTLSIMIMIILQLDIIILLVCSMYDFNTPGHIMDYISDIYAPLVRVMISWLIILSFDFMDSWYKCCCSNACCNCIKDCCTKSLRKNAKFSLYREFDSMVNLK